MRTKITPALMREHHACYSDAKLRDVLGDGLTPREVLNLCIPAADRIWALTRPGVALTKQQLWLFACACAERVLPLWEERYPDDERPHVAIQVATAYALGEATADAATFAAADAARAAADAARAACAADDAARATSDAARAAADAARATSDAASAAAASAATFAVAATFAAAADAAAAAERAWQLGLMRRMIADGG